jgi:hypothetical protein
MMFSSVRWFVDCGHGWLRVPIVSGEGLTFSEYSYIDRSGGCLYLEEDCDAGVWLRAHGLSGSAFGVVHFDTDCFVRDLPRVVVGVRS